MKAWRVAGVLVLIGAEALLYGYTYPFFSLALEERGLANWLIGLNASLAGAGILIVGPALPWLIARLGVRILVAGLFGVSLLSFAAILAADNLVVWFVARFVMGACFAALWTATEIWLNGVVDDRRRGRIIGASGTLYATCQFFGPVVLGGVGIGGSLPILVAMLPLAVGVVVALSIRSAEGAAEDEENLTDTASLGKALRVATALLAAAFLGGIGETAMQALLPLYGLAHGLDTAGAAQLVAIFSLGEAVLVAGLGWMADRYGRRITLIACAFTATLASAAIPFAVMSTFTLWPVLFIGGGTIAGIYTLGVVLIGTDFRGQKLAVVSTGFAMAYAAGSIVGSTPIGLLIDVFGPEALPIAIAIGFLGLTLFLVRRKPEKRRPAAELPEIEFDLSFLTEAPPALGAHAAEPLAFSVAESVKARDHRREGPDDETGDQWQERHLEKWFRERSAELARRAADRELREGQPVRG
jgi:MFS family permease